MQEMTRIERDHLWERDAKQLRDAAGLIGGIVMLAGIIAVVAGGVMALNFDVAAGLLIGINGLITVAVGWLIRCLGRGIACLIEITWYGLIDKRSEG